MDMAAAGRGEVKRDAHDAAHVGLMIFETMAGDAVPGSSPSLPTPW